MRGDGEYIADTFLLEKVFKLDAALAGEYAITKTAGITDMLSGVSGSIISSVKGMLDTSSTGSFIKSVLKILESGIFFKIHPLLGILSTLGQVMFGVSLTGLFSSLISNIMPKIKAGEKVSPEEVNQAGESLVGVTASDLLSDLRRLEKKGELTKVAFLPVVYGQRFGRTPVGGKFFPDKNTPLLYKIFGFLGPGRGKRLLVGFLVWFLKTALLGMGLLGVGSAVAGMFGSKEQEHQQPEYQLPEVTAPRQQASPIPVPAIPAGLKGSGWGTQHFKNDSSFAWIIPLGNKKPKDLLIEWTKAAYPELEVINLPSLPSFNKTLRLFSQNYTPGSDKIVVPPGFNRPIDVVNQFAGDLYRQSQRGS